MGLKSSNVTVSVTIKTSDIWPVLLFVVLWNLLCAAKRDKCPQSLHLDQKKDKRKKVCVCVTVRQAGWTICAQLEHSIRMREESPVSSWLGSLQTSHTADRGRPGWRGQTDRDRQRVKNQTGPQSRRTGIKEKHSQRDTVLAHRSAWASRGRRTSSCLCRSYTLHTLVSYRPHSAYTCRRTTQLYFTTLTKNMTDNQLSWRDTVTCDCVS